MSELPPLNEELAPGDQSDHVLAMQERLAEFGYFHDAVDGVFGESTEDALREFQRNYGLPEDGRVGPETWEALGRETVSYAEPEPAGPEVGELSEDGQWRWDGSDWQAVNSSEPTDATPGMLSEDGQWRWDGEQWQPVGSADEEMSTEQFQDVIAQSMQVNSSEMA
ncbi:Putative peptidoglycan binding domain-containing protein [Actinokineospora alba]|uniref:Putative peptidoglycan binding domain-containing protein n=1 Tax=Actinokineospora alba TaxID=504798 RepID=A0A1H0U0N5_9PSEU|nr:peptidoglycan-binding domain-containing protein [Actinokineospora alba]TDP70833.1 putative peptidoglycan binding protein [Actinokineospora alba]SDJ17651.1 Putative peptidoglycan binding domain-containing protein [Actinokineospora alba]SDP59749.1 Putative peptidoglycan binding domain-containing protein [Actinokineospora alba]